MPQRCRWRQYADGHAFDNAVLEFIDDSVRRAIRERHSFYIVLAGGNTPQPIYKKLAQMDYEWAAWHIFFGDERCLPLHDPARNSTMACDAWLNHVPIPRSQIHVIPAQDGPEQAALAYAKLLQDVRQFDLVLLGLGEDGHTASLFPGKDWGTEPGARDVLPIREAPKPPSERVSLSAKRLSLARGVAVMVKGKDKLPALQDWQSGKKLPISAIRPEHGLDVFVSELT